ncbi:MAG: sucrose synthase [Gemmatimonadetes bacterium]|nr:sucrose synthase [Gemmatimonadota bacterium]
MIRGFSRLLRTHRDSVYAFFQRLEGRGRPFLLWSDLVQEFEALAETDVGARLRGTPLESALRRTQEAIFAPSMVYRAVREEVARWRYLQIHLQELHLREIGVAEYLDVKERVVRPGSGERYALEVDLTPFERGFPRISDPADIGRGVEFLNRHLCERLERPGTAGADKVFDFLRVHHVRGRQLMLNELIETGKDLRDALDEADRELAQMGEGDDWVHLVRHLGFEPGWGRTPSDARAMMALLGQVLDEPTPEVLARFLGKVPMIFSLAIVSPHGYFGQANVLGKPDTGGQVVYILDQVRALERAMRASLQAQGVDVEPQIVVLTRLIPEADDTTCNVPLEPILGTESARILRVPFRDANHEVVSHWIPRFDVWPYLERFAVEAQKEILAELGSRPDMVIGNYSDGNLVASILTHRLGVTQCNIAHALEKTKYLQSDLYWAEMEPEYHFSCQFTADLIAMNTADFIITSTYQEIAGKDDSIGQYESYQSFSLPDLYRVVSGIDCFDPKFNILSPGADPETFFPYSQVERRPEALTDAIEAMVYGPPHDAARGQLTREGRPILFAMSRLDRIKNMAGFLDWYARSEKLQEEADVLLVGGRVNPDRCLDDDERRQARLMHEIITRHGLDARVRWLEMQTNKNTVGGLYRFVADTRGAFVQPALFEAFGLTVVEAMSSGLPPFVTRYGGPLEIVEDGVSGFHIDPTAGDEAARRMADFLRRSREDGSVWERVSEGALQRVRARYSWELYAAEFLRLSRIYGFWRHISSLEREETRRYLEMFYGLMYRKRAAAVGET